LKSGDFGEFFPQKNPLNDSFTQSFFFGSPSGQNSPTKKNPDLGFMFS
jgi:hypothetical protein